MGELIIKSKDLDSISITKLASPHVVSITVLDDLEQTSNSISLTFNQAKEIRDYLDNILKDR